MEKVLDHGFVELVEHMPQENLDKAIVDGARVSPTKRGLKTTRGDRGLIRYLLRHWHTLSPFEVGDFQVSYQGAHLHRTAVASGIEPPL
jgi:thymidylate synthase (FAD)